MPTIDPNQFGVSFSVKECRNYRQDPVKALGWLINEAGFRRFRLMSYWNEHEKQPGQYDFKALDKQIDQIEKVGGVITLCLGARQPRWPENHWPDWAWQLPSAERGMALLGYIEVVIKRYRDRKCIISYQLENEALLKQFGERPDVNRKRLRTEYKLVKQLDPTRPVIMSTSTSWGIPLRRPIPDVVGFSYYQVLYDAKNKRYSTAFHTPLLHRVRALLIRLTVWKPVFIHELQLEPWGPTANWKMTSDQQADSMGLRQIARNIELAKAVRRYPIDLWGGEWWYWRHMQGDDEIWQAVNMAIFCKYLIEI